MAMNDSNQNSFAGPNFIIEQDGVVYVAIAVLQYDPHAPEMSDQQRAGVRQMQDMLKDAVKTRRLEAAPLHQNWYAAGCMITIPRPKFWGTTEGS
jgi:hypothetical protein